MRTSTNFAKSSVAISSTWVQFPSARRSLRNARADRSTHTILHAFCSFPRLPVHIPRLARKRRTTLSQHRRLMKRVGWCSWFYYSLSGSANGTRNLVSRNSTPLFAAGRTVHIVTSLRFGVHEALAFLLGTAFARFSLLTMGVLCVLAMPSTDVGDSYEKAMVVLAVFIIP